MNYFSFLTSKFSCGINVLQTMAHVRRKSIEERIKDCRQLLNPGKIILCLEELLLATEEAMVAYTLGSEYEKTGDIKMAIKYYEKAESLFTLDNYKNMARAAMNNLQIEVILTEKKRAKIKPTEK